MREKFSWSAITSGFTLALFCVAWSITAPLVAQEETSESSGSAEIEEVLEGTASLEERRFTRGMQLFNDGDYRAAIEAFNSVLELDATHEGATDYRNRSESKLSQMDSNSDTAAGGFDDSTDVTQAERHYRLGVSLYRDGNYRESLDEFNRAVALDPALSSAQDFKDKAEAKLNVASTGEDPHTIPTFETFDPESIDALAESPQLSAEEHKIQKVRELVELAERFLEFQFFEEAVEYFEQVLLIAPDNRRAKNGLHDATIGAYRAETESTGKSLREQSERMRTFIERKKLLPPGADPSGIKNYRISVPKIEERFDDSSGGNHIEEVLESPVGVVFEDIHLRDILDFITDTYEINIMVDNRVVAAPEDNQSAAAAAPTAAGGRAGAIRGGNRARGTPSITRSVRGGGGGGRGGGGRGGGGRGGGGRGGSGGFDLDLGASIVTDGMISYINLKNVTLREALKAILRPLNLDFSVQNSFIWISTPQSIREETFEDLETRYYELRYAGADTLFKLVLNPPRSGLGEPAELGSLGQQNIGGGSGGGGSGGGGGGGSNSGDVGVDSQETGSEFNSIAALFATTFDDIKAGEFPNPLAALGGTGGGGRGGRGGNRGGQDQDEDDAALGIAGSTNGEPFILDILRRIVGDVFEPITGRRLSFMRFDLLRNQLIVHNTPSNLAKLEKQLKHLDTTPKQVSIEAKFLTINITDGEKQGFNWNLALSDLNGRQRGIEGVTVPEPPSSGGSGGGGGGGGTGDSGFAFDIDGDGDLDILPPGRRPDGTNIIDNSVLTSTIAGLATPGAALVGQGLSIGAILTDNSDGDTLSVVFEYLDSFSEAELLSAPRVTTLNQKPAVIVDTTQEWFITAVQTLVNTSTGGGNNSETTTVVTQTKVPQLFTFGITLSVTPQIAGTDQIRMWLNPQVKTLAGTTTIPQTTLVDGDVFNDFLILPKISSQAVWTNVIVHDGDTLVLGGLVTDRTFKDEERMPYLSRIPVIGFFFRGKSRQVTQSSLLIFVTPEIIDTTGARYFEAGL